MSTNRQVFVLAGAFVLLTATANLGHAQWGPYGYGGWYGGWGAGTFNTTRELHEQDRMQARAMTASRNARVGGEVRDTLLNEANARTQAAISQQQSARDWWFQTQQRQVAEQAARTASRSLPPLAYAPASGTTMATTAAASTKSLIQWPAVLLDPRFTAQRASVEAPFARFAEGGATVTVAEYRAMIATAEAMKQQLDGLATEITAAEYLAAQKFLEQLAGEAQQRIAELTPAEAKAAG